MDLENQRPVKYVKFKDQPIFNGIVPRAYILLPQNSWTAKTTIPLIPDAQLMGPRVQHWRNGHDICITLLLYHNISDINNYGAQENSCSGSSLDF